MKKRTGLICALLAALLLLAGCGQQETGKTTAAETAPAEKLSLRELVDSEAPDAGDLAVLTAEDLTDMLGIVPDDYTEFVFLQSTGMDGREILAIRAANRDAADRVAKQAETYLERRMKETRNYAPEAYRLQSETKVRTRNLTVLLVVGPDAAKEADAILAGE